MAGHRRATTIPGLVAEEMCLPEDLRSQPWRAAYGALLQCSMSNYPSGCGIATQDEGWIMTRWRRLAQNRLLDVGAVVVMLLLLSRWVVILPTRWCDYDFNHYYVGSRILLERQNPYTTSPEGMSHALGFTSSEHMPNAGYPPSFLWLLTPLA